MNNYSPNMLKTFEECQQKFFFKYIKKISLPQRSTIFEKGKKIHALANYFLNNENIEKMEKVLTADEKIAWESLKSNKYFKMNVLNTEYNLSCKIDKYWIGGRLDAFMFDGKDYFILDYKTGYLPQNAEQDFQTIVYLLCTDKFLNKKSSYNSLRFVYIGLKEGKEKEILLSKDLKEQYEERIVSACKKIDLAVNSNVFSPNKEICKNCEYNKFCNC